MDFNPEPFDLSAALVHWLATFGGVAVLLFLAVFVGSLVMYGAFGPGFVFGWIRNAAADLAGVSCRRTWALARLTIKEAVRRKALMVFVVFAILFMFAGWFLTDANERADLQIKVYVSFVLMAITWLIVPVVMILACWGLPEDIKARSLHTVVTKPARKSEIVVGRILGFAIVGTFLLAIMSGIGYLWILRQTPSVLRQVEEQVGDRLVSAVENRDGVEVVVTGADGETERYQAASLRELRRQSPDVYRLLDAARDAKLNKTLVSRVPVYGELTFLDRQGSETKEGVNTGDIWMFRSYIEGATRARGIWNFSGIHVSDREQPLTLESRFEAFRTHKGKMGTGLLCRFILVNDDKDLKVTLPPFEVAEFKTNLFELAPKLTYYDSDAKTMQTVSLYDDVIDDGRLTVEVQCLDHSQYLGMARPDLFIRLPDKHFASGYFKSIAGIWLMLSLIVVLSVTASCFVKGPVATLLIFSVIIFGRAFREFMEEMSFGDMKGGGALESIYRILTHMNPMTDMPDNWATTVIQAIDQVFHGMLWLMVHVIPDFRYFRLSPYIANGFDVPWWSNPGLVPGISMMLAYLIPCLLIGYYSLSLRELESK